MFFSSVFRNCNTQVATSRKMCRPVSPQWVKLPRASTTQRARALMTTMSFLSFNLYLQRRQPSRLSQSTRRHSLPPSLLRLVRIAAIAFDNPRSVMCLSVSLSAERNASLPRTLGSSVLYRLVLCLSVNHVIIDFIKETHFYALV